MRCSLVALVAGLLVAAIDAQATEQSQLTCFPASVLPNQNVTCYIYAMDYLQEPTSAFQLSDFSPRVITQIPLVSVSISPLIVTGDPTVLVFFVSVASGTTALIQVYMLASGAPIRQSGFTATVLAAPPLTLTGLACNPSVAILRNTVTCTANAFGAYSVPANVGSMDIVFTEDHNAGAFTFVSGFQQLVFNYTAPSSPNSIYTVSVIRATVVSSGNTYNTSLTLSYPLLPPTTSSLLTCGGNQWCTVTSMDLLGPVLFSNTSFSILFEGQVGTNTWVANLAPMAYTWSPAQTTSQQMISFGPVMRNKVFIGRLSVMLNGNQITGSPYVFPVGLAPTAGTTSLAGCDNQFLSAGYTTTTCTLTFATGVSADASYVTFQPTIGTVVNVTFVLDPTSTNGGGNLQFTYVPPQVLAAKTQGSLAVLVGGAPVLNSPYIFFVFPSGVTSSPQIQKSTTGQILIGFFYFGGVYLTGLVCFILLRRKIAHLDDEDRAMQEVEPEPIKVGSTSAPERHT